MTPSVKSLNYLANILARAEATATEGRLSAAASSSRKVFGDRSSSSRTKDMALAGSRSLAAATASPASRPD